MALRAMVSGHGGGGLEAGLGDLRCLFHSYGSELLLFVCSALTFNMRFNAFKRKVWKLKVIGYI